MKLKNRSLIFCLLLLCLIISPVFAQTVTTISVSGTVITHNPVHKPISSFTAIPKSGREPLTVQFTDTSTYSPKTWKWEYKSDNSGWKKFSNLQNPAYTFLKGKYDIRLTVSNNAGSDTSTKQEYITVSEKVKKPIARFSANPSVGQDPLKVIFKDNSLNNPIVYQWNFGDGTTSFMKNPPAHIYTRPGFYRVKLTVSNSAGSDTTNQIITVLPHKWWNNWHWW